MEKAQTILSELREIAPFLANVEITREPYMVYPGYFNDFIEILMLRIHLQENSFAESTAGKEELTSLLAELRDKSTYQVPKGFFDGLRVHIPDIEKTMLQSDVSEAEINQAPVRRISLPMRVIRYAAAACIVGLIGLAVFNISGNKNADPINSLTTVSEQDMANYLQSNDFDLSDTTSSGTTETASLDFTDSEIHELLSNVSDAELEQYTRSLPIEKRNVN